MTVKIKEIHTPKSPGKVTNVKKFLSEKEQL